jgi:putative oxidoreductase
MVMDILTIIGWVLSLATGLFLGKGAVEKIIGTPKMLGNFEFMKLEKYRLLTGVGELLGVILLLIPQTSIFGAILISSFMSAAAVLHLSLMGGNKVEVPILVGVGALLGYFLRVI